MATKNVLQEAIADAKIIRETALINAKNALEEALTPKFKNMMSKKLNEMEDLNLDEEFNFDNDQHIPEKTPQSPNDSSFDFDNDNLDEELASILQELEESEDLDLDEAKDKVKDEDSKDKDKSKSKEDKPKEDKEKSKPKEEAEPSGDTKISSLTVDQFTDLIQTVVSQEMNSDGSGGETDNLDGMDDLGATDDLGKSKNFNDDEEIDMQELMSELDEMYSKPSNLQELKKTKLIANQYKSKSNEAMKVINVLRKEINEINLLNAKLLYVNKIFKAKNLNESQKLKVISTFDKALNVKEAKLIFETFNSSISYNNNLKKPSMIKENLGYASKPIGATKSQILEVNDQFARMQKLAGIN